MPIPLEILRAILREATSIPSAFTYPLQEPEVQEFQIARLIASSLAIKGALSLTSKLVHSLTNEFLYEIILIRHYAHIRPLVELLLRQSSRDGPQNGWWCRRLEVRLAYDGEGWSWGRYALWGLLPACPRLVDLRCSITCYSSDMRAGAGWYGTRFPVSEKMLATIASSQRGLRSLEFSGVTPIPFESAARLLRNLPELEVCVLKMVEPDGVAPACIDNSVGPSSAPATPPPSWPPPPSPSEEHTQSLPSLRAFWLSSFNNTRDLHTWHLPSLQKFTAEYHCPSTECTSHLLSCLRSPFLSSVIGFTFVGPRIDLWAIVTRLPQIEHFRLVLPHDGFDEGSSGLQEPHECLARITVFESGSGEALGVGQALRSVLDMKQRGRLPRLERVRARGDERCARVVETWRGRFAEMNLELEVRDVRMVK